LARTRLRQEPATDLRWLETGLREALRREGKRLLGELLQDPALILPGDRREPGERRLAKQRRTIQTLFGPVELCRHGYYHPRRQSVRYPLDEALQVMQGLSPHLAELMCRSAAREPFAVASEDLEAYTGLTIDARQFQRLVERVGPLVRTIQAALPDLGCDPIPRLYVAADGTGVPLRSEELTGRRGRQADGSAKTHEVKLGCVFTQHPKPGEDPLRDWASTTYLATTQRAPDFAPLLLTEARRRGLGRAQQVVFLSDGAAWIKEIVRTCFPQAIWVLDFYHAAQHVKALAEALDGPDTPAAHRRFKTWRRRLLKGRLACILQEARAARRLANTDQRHRELAYLETNQGGMDYATFQAQGIFIGSGVVEAACKTVVSKRLKQSGMFWSQAGAENVLALRAALYSHQFKPIWSQNLAAQLKAA
jgi:hypothetical protein